jgi:hypothetical protein
MVERGTVECGTVECGTVECGTVECGTVECGTVECGTVECGTVECGTVAMIERRENLSNREGELVPLPFCPPQIPHGLTWDRSPASLVTGR